MMNALKIIVAYLYEALKQKPSSKLREEWMPFLLQKKENHSHGLLRRFFLFKFSFTFYDANSIRRKLNFTGVLISHLWELVFFRFLF